MIQLYPQRKVKGQSFKGVKKSVVPNQSMTLKEVLKRFIKHEALPTLKEGTYSEDHGDLDLEKFNSEDITVKEEIIAEQRERVKGMRDKVENDKKSAMEKAKAAKKAEQEKMFSEYKDSLKSAFDPKQPKE